MKITSFLVLSFPLALALNSCAPPAQNNQNAAGTYNDPNNPYAVPGMTDQGAYAPAEQAPYQDDTSNSSASAPYQPIPSNDVNPPATSSPNSSTPTPSPSTPEPSGNAGGASHVVASGDTLWGLSRKYDVSVADIKQANGLTDDTIRTGQTLRIP